MHVTNGVGVLNPTKCLHRTLEMAWFKRAIVLCPLIAPTM